MQSPLPEVATLHVVRGSACNQQKEIGIVQHARHSAYPQPSKCRSSDNLYEGTIMQLKRKCCKINQMNLTDCPQWYYYPPFGTVRTEYPRGEVQASHSLGYAWVFLLSSVAFPEAQSRIFYSKWEYIFPDHLSSNQCILLRSVRNRDQRQ